MRRPASCSGTATAISVSPDVGKRDDRLAGADDLARLARHRRDDAGLVGLERSVADRVDGLAQLRLRALQRRRGRIQLVAPGVVGRLRDECLWATALGALEIVAGHIATAARRGDGGSAALSASLRSVSSRRAITWPTSTRSPTLTRRSTILPGTRKPSALSILGRTTPE